MPRKSRKREGWTLYGTRLTPGVLADVGIRLLAAAAFWLAVSGADPAGFLVGLLAVVLATVVSIYLIPLPWGLAPLRPSVRLVLLLLRNMVIGGLGVARCAFLPRHRMVDPGFVDYRLPKPSHEAALGLSYILTLIPGTAGAEVTDETLRLHALNRPGALEGIAAMESALAEIAEAIGTRRDQWTD